MRLRALSATLLGLLLLIGFALLWLTQDTPLAPARLIGVFRADGLSALLIVVIAAHGLVDVALGAAAWRAAVTAWLLGLTVVAEHLGGIGGLLALAGLLADAPSAARRPVWRQIWRLAPLGAAAGLGLIGMSEGEWRYSAPMAGAGLHSPAFALIGVSALLGLDMLALAGARPPAASALASSGCLYVLLRLFSLGPWNLGWLFAALLMGGLVALWAAWRAAFGPPALAGSWLGMALGGIVIAGAGLGSGAGLTTAGYALLLWPVLRLGLEDPAIGSRALWGLSAATPLSGPFVAGWMATAAALAGGVPTLGLALWLTALLAALPPARLACTSPVAPDPAAPPAKFSLLRAWFAAALSIGLGLGAPLILVRLLAPLAAHLQGGLTPFGEIALWPWAGLIALNAARQPVATLPSLALAGLMIILSALCWIGLRLIDMVRRDG